MNPQDKATSIFTRNFGGLCPRLSNYQQSRFLVLGIPYESPTSFIQGTSGGPGAIIDASMNMELYDEQLNRRTFEQGICTRSPFTSTDFVEDLCGSIRREMADHVEADKFVVSLGGEQPITVGLVDGCLGTYPDLTVLQLGAFARLRNTDNGDPLTHNTAMRRISEKVPVVQVGIRSLNSEEAGLINSPPVTTIMAQDMVSGDDWKKRMFDHLSGDIYLTIDGNVFDPSVMPDAGRPVPGGLFWYPTLELLRDVFSRCNVVGMDVVELCPIRADITSVLAVAKLAYRCMGYAAENFK